MWGCLNGNTPAENKIKQGLTEIKTKTKALWALAFFPPVLYLLCSNLLFLSWDQLLNDCVPSPQDFSLSSCSSFTFVEPSLRGTDHWQASLLSPFPQSRFRTAESHIRCVSRNSKERCHFLWFHLENVILLSLCWQLICAWHCFGIPVALHKWAPTWDFI